MKKSILMKNNVRVEMGIEEVLLNFRGLAIKTYKMYKGVNEVSDDDKQELDIVIFKTFQGYDEVHSFSTPLVWNIRSYITETNNKNNAIKRSAYQTISLDFKFGGDSEDDYDFHETLCDESCNIVDDFFERDLMSYINVRLNEVEKELLLINLDEKRMIDVANERGWSKQNVYKKNKAFKEKIAKLIKEYNRI